MKNSLNSLKKQRQRESNRVSVLFLLPVMLILLVFVFYPIFEAFRVSGYSWNGISGNPIFVGLDNWKKLLGDSKFWAAFRNNLTVMVLSILIQIPLGLLLATFMEFTGKKSNIFKLLWFLPMLMSSVAIGFLFSYALATNGGLFSSLSQLLGRGNVNLLGDPKVALYTVIGVIAWQYTPFYMVYAIAGYTNISEELYEAALIDGASKGQYFFNIALPLLTPTLKNAAILSMVGSLKYFDLIYVMTGGGPGTSTELMTTYMYKLSFARFNMGYGSTVAAGMFILISAIALLTLRLLNRKTGKNNG